MSEKDKSENEKPEKPKEEVKFSWADELNKITTKNPKLINNFMEQWFKTKASESKWNASLDFVSIGVQAIIMLFALLILYLTANNNIISGDAFVGFLGVFFGYLFQYGINLPKKYEIME